MNDYGPYNRENALRFGDCIGTEYNTLPQTLKATVII